MKKNQDTRETKDVLILIAKIVAFIVLLNFIGFLIGKGIQKAIEIGKKARENFEEECPCEDCETLFFGAEDDDDDDIFTKEEAEEEKPVFEDEIPQ